MSGLKSDAALKLALERLDETINRVSKEENIRSLSEVRALVAEVLLDMDAPQDGDRRRDMRMSQTAVSVIRRGGTEYDCVIEDLSVGGALIDADADLGPDDLVEIELPRAGTVQARVIGRSPAGMHIAFLEPTETQRRAILDGFAGLLWK